MGLVFFDPGVTHQSTLGSISKHQAWGSLSTELVWLPADPTCSLWKLSNVTGLMCHITSECASWHCSSWEGDIVVLTCDGMSAPNSVKEISNHQLFQEQKIERGVLFIYHIRRIGLQNESDVDSIFYCIIIFRAILVYKRLCSDVSLKRNYVRTWPWAIWTTWKLGKKSFMKIRRLELGKSFPLISKTAWIPKFLHLPPCLSTTSDPHWELHCFVTHLQVISALTL